MQNYTDTNKLNLKIYYQTILKKNRIKKINIQADKTKNENK